VGVADFDGDGKLDIFSGDSWYQAPRWKRHKVREVRRKHPLYLEDFADMPLDVNGDGRPDLVTCSFFTERVGWIEHPGDPRQPWIEHTIDTPGPSEACRLVDVDGDGQLDLLPNTLNVMVWYQLETRRPAVRWKRHLVGKEAAGHGVGIGDLDGDGRLDLVGPNGWNQQPARRDAPWAFHPDFRLGSAGISILVRDVDGDGLTDLVWGTPHGYGLQWLRQQRAAAGGGPRRFVRQEIDGTLAELHTLLWADLDGSGRPTFVTGKRVYAHEIEPGATDAPGVYAFRFDGATGRWDRQVIHEGKPARDAPAAAEQRDALKDFARGTAGTGLHIEAVDIDRDGDLDLVCPGKSGLYLFENLHGRRPAGRRR
jgi:hypothetical protein